ncbi:mechanosensitive ion channel family protein [Brevundimonas halotolerans]|uniref:Small-conductance mechanosensitive channel n=1 Tax=Brevundimonas halotolerans TaxID=69670 RepID=A0A7W9A5G1_9CAUL|nr:mechanosensitive ion channel domain-containing protein [Brevundimonas halotolerans]MBB5661370.1 small-conductance mechanosensitive channel [Brevundimonas halotolerans]
MVNELTELQDAAVLRLGGISLTLGGLLTAAIIIAVAGALSWAATRAIRRLRYKATRSTQALYLLEKMTGYGILIAGLFMALSAAGLNLSSLAVFAGAIGIGLGLGLQGVVKEFVSGLFLIFDRMVSVGDYVELDDARGAIVEIGPRATRIRTNDNINIIVPNSSLIEGKVTNWTLKGDTRRIHVPFSVAYGADRAEVRDVVLKAARAIPFTLPETEARKCQVWLVGFGESGLDFELLVWPTQDAVKRPAAMHAAYTWAIAEALDEAGIEIPFPQTDLRIRSVFGREGDDALEILGRAPKGRSRKSAPSEATPKAAAQGSNDAVEDLLRPSSDPVEKERLSGEDR